MTAAVDPVLIVLVFSALAAGIAAAGALPFGAVEEVPLQWLGCANALASGFMLGSGYILMAEGLAKHGALLLMGGAALGVLYTYWTHSFSGTEEIETIPRGEIPLPTGYKIILLNALHSASEGVAIGVAMVVSLRLGVFMALALAVHNIAEAMTLTAVLQRRSLSLRESAGICVIAKVPQILLAVATFAVVRAAGGALSWALGFAAGALVYLVLTELLPSSYKRAGHTCIAVLVSFSAGVVVLLKGFLG